jgi:hypothetical protein
MKKLILRLLVASAVGIAVWQAVESRRRSGRGAHHSAGRQHQVTEDGEGVVDEWGKESFPASDPPQSW